MTKTPGINHQPVTAWLAANISGAVPPFDFEFIVGGHSNLTYKVTTADGQRFVLRRPPLGAVIATAHDMAREHRIISGVGQTTVPVPAALGLCEDDSVNGAPFYVMNYVDGVVLHSAEDSEAATDRSARAAVSQSAVDVLASLHLVNPDDVGLGTLGRKEAYLDRQLKRWSTQWDKTKTRDLPEMEQAHGLLLKAKPEQRYTGIVHGDYRLGNMLLDVASGQVNAVLDWELCTLGDVLADVGYLLNRWIQPGEEVITGATEEPTMVGGFSTREDLIAAYTRRTGFDVGNLDYYRAFQNWRLAAILEGVVARYQGGVMVDDTVDLNQYKDQVEALVDESLRLLQPN